MAMQRDPLTGSGASRTEVGAQRSFG